MTHVKTYLLITCCQRIRFRFRHGVCDVQLKFEACRFSRRCDCGEQHDCQNIKLATIEINLQRYRDKIDLALSLKKRSSD